MAGIPTNRTSGFTLPPEISEEILAKMQTESAVMRLAREIELPGRGVSIPVILGDPSAAWVAETDEKPVSNPSISTKTMVPYKLAVIVPFSKEFRRDAAALYDELVRRLPAALAYKFDQTVVGAVQAPGNDFDTLANAQVQSLDTDVYDALVLADTDIAVNGGIMNGIALAPQGRGVLLAAKDKNDRPLFINSAAEGAVPMVLGAPTVISRGIYAEGVSANAVGIAGDWTQAMYGTVEGVIIDYSEDATLTLADNSTINLFQRNMFAVRAEIEIGFVCDEDCFNLLTVTPASE